MLKQNNIYFQLKYDHIKYFCDVYICISWHFSFYNFTHTYQTFFILSSFQLKV